MWFKNSDDTPNNYGDSPKNDGTMKNNFLKAMLFLFTIGAIAQTDQVSVLQNDEGMKLVVNGEDFMINGMNWDYTPIGTSVINYSLWKQSDDVIKAALDSEMGLLKNMGVNAIRQYVGVQPKWTKYIYENYGIYTMINHSFGRYGLTINGVWVVNTEYSDPATQELLLSEVTAMVNKYAGTPGLLMYLLGNENNYGLFWDGAETEDIPVEDRKSTTRARAMYKIFNKAALAMKDIDKSLPVAMCNGDLLFIDIIAEECKDVDIFGTNMYRGISFTDAFKSVKDKLNMPLMFTEFGADAFNAKENQEDQTSQAYYMVGNWKEIYENAAGLGKAGNSIGGFTFQFSDGWWKFGQTKNLDVHDNNASWSNGGYARDLEEGENNMNEEWFGICAKGPTNSRGLYDLYPRAAYYALKEAHQLNPYDEGVTLDFVKNHFDNIELTDAMLRARGDKAALGAQSNSLVRVSNLRAEFTTFNTGGNLLTTPDSEDPDERVYPNELGFDHMQSYYVGVEGNPSSNMRANVNFNILGNVAENPIDEIFYENRGRVRSVNTDEGNLDLTDLNRVQIYSAEYTWNAKDFDLRGFYRTGHYHWGYEGDFFGLYPESNYGPNLDLYNGEISGFELDGKKALNGLKAAFGPQLWWGANPAVLLKYKITLGKLDITGVYHEDLDDAAHRVLKDLSGLEDVYMEQVRTFGKANRDPYERVVSTTYSALILKEKYNQELIEEYRAEWFPIDELPDLIFDHKDMVESAIRRLQRRVRTFPIVFNLLPEKFTLPQLQKLYEGIFQVEMDKRNFRKKLATMDFLVKLNEKDMSESKKGAFLYRFDEKKYNKTKNFTI